MCKIIIIGANGAVGKSCASKLNDKELVLISRSKFDDNNPKNSQVLEHVLDLNDYAKTTDFINKIDYEISGIIFAIGSISLKPFSNTKIDDFVFYYVYGLFKIAVIVQQIFYRFKKGLTTNKKFSELNKYAKVLCDTAWQSIQKKQIENLF